MKITEMKAGRDYLVSHSRDWLASGGRRMRWTGETFSESKVTKNFGRGDTKLTDHVMAAAMAPVRDDGSLGQAERTALMHIKTPWARGAAAVIAFRSEMDEEERQDLAEQEEIRALTAEASAPECTWQGRHHVQLSRDDWRDFLRRVVTH